MNRTPFRMPLLGLFLGLFLVSCNGDSRGNTGTTLSGASASGPAPSGTMALPPSEVVTSTEVRVFQPFNADGIPREDLKVVAQVREDFCQSGAFSVSDYSEGGKRVGRPDAWRCGARDPCFAARGQQFVLCAHDPFSKEVTQVFLSSGQPLRDGNEPGLNYRPWALELSNGDRCTYGGSGPGPSVAGQRATYACGPGTTIFGPVDTSTKVWTAMAQAKASSDIVPVKVRVGYR
jgi:hypothetical protein